MVGVSGHVGCEDVLVDVGDDSVEGAGDGTCVAQQYGGIGDVVECEVFLRVFHAEGVYIDGDDFTGTSQGHGDGEDTSSSAHVKHPLVGEVALEKEADDLVSGGVRTRAEGHAWTELYAEFTLEDRVEAILFPFGVPVFVFEGVEAVGEGDAGEGKVVESGFELVLVEVGLGDVGFEASGCVFERFVTDVGEQGGKNVAGVVGEGSDGDVSE